MTPALVTAIGLFVGVVVLAGGAAIVVVLNRLDAARHRAILLETALDSERSRRNTLASEASHRLGNNLATISSLLGLQVMRSESREVRLALEAARGRVHAIAAGTRGLNQNGLRSSLARADVFIPEIVSDTTRQAGMSRSVSINCFVDAVDLRPADAMNLSIILSELVSNALRHGLAGNGKGVVEVRFTAEATGALLTVEDSGTGFAASEATGLGLTIASQLARQFDGAIETGPSPLGGARIHVCLPSIVVDHGARDDGSV